MNENLNIIWNLMLQENVQKTTKDINEAAITESKNTFSRGSNSIKKMKSI